MLEYKKSNLIKIRDKGFDESWLKDRIEEDPSILNLGELDIIQRERPQSSGGRIDFLMADTENNIRYEIEVMLGKLDESHIIRTIEYWDIERKKFPTYEHRAVIIAEEITNRFFNIIGLFNQAIPIIAIQLNSFQFDNNIILSFTKVLDIREIGYMDDAVPSETVNRQYWEKRSDEESMKLSDEIIKFVPEDYCKREITYNKSHIAIRTSGVNFLWLHPRKIRGYVHFHLRVNSNKTHEIVENLRDAGIDVKLRRNEKEIIVQIYVKGLRENTSLVKDVIEKSEKWSRDDD